MNKLDNWINYSGVPLRWERQELWRARNNYDFIMKQPTHFHNFSILVVTVLVANTSTTTSGHLFFFVVFFILFIFT